MSIASEITRIQDAKSDIADAIEAKGVTVPASTKIDGYAALVSAIPQGTSEITYPVVVETQTTGTYTLSPNTFVKFGTIESIGFTLDTTSEVSGHVNEYVVQFDTYHTPPTVGFPSTVIFPETLTLEADMTYQISIVNNLALVQSWPNS